MKYSSFVATSEVPVLASLTVAFQQLQEATETAHAATGSARQAENALDGAQRATQYRSQATINERQSLCITAWCREQAARRPLMDAMRVMQTALMVATAPTQRNASWEPWLKDTLKVNVVASHELFITAIRAYGRIRPYNESKVDRQDLTVLVREATHFSASLPQLPGTDTPEQANQWDFLILCLRGKDVVSVDGHESVVASVAERLRAAGWGAKMQTRNDCPDEHIKLGFQPLPPRMGP